MTITTTTLTKTSAVAAAAAGLLFIAVQVKHPSLDVAFTTTTEWKVRESMKVLFAALSLAGIAGMYLRQVRKTGVLGLLGYVLFSVGYLAMMSVEVVGAVVLPSIAHSAPGYVTDVLAVATAGRVAAGSHREDVGDVAGCTVSDGWQDDRAHDFDAHHGEVADAEQH